MVGLFKSWRSASVAGHKGPSNDHFDGERFTTTTRLKPKSLWTILKWRFAGRSRIRWPRQGSSPISTESIQDAGPQELRLTFINHASWLIQIDGLNILTDPIWSDTAGPASWLGPKRARAAGIALEHLPRIDAVLISHNHYDHLDIPTLEKLEARDHPLFIAGLGNASFLKKFGLQKIQELDWWQTVHIGKTAFHFVPVKHWSRRGWSDFNKTLWGGYILQNETKTMFFAGDTGYGDHFKKIRDRFPSIDIALLPIGAYEPRWFMKESHMNPEEAVQASQDLAARQSYGMHFGTFQLSDEAIDQPIHDLKTALQKSGLSANRFIVPVFGVTYNSTPQTTLR